MKKWGKWFCVVFIVFGFLQVGTMELQAQVSPQLVLVDDYEGYGTACKGWYYSRIGTNRGMWMWTKCI